MEPATKLPILLEQLAGKKLQSAFRLEETELFCFSFGEARGQTVTQEGKPWNVYEYALHVQCVFDVVSKNASDKRIVIDGDSATDSFLTAMRPLLTKVVDQVVLHKNHELVLSLGEYLLVIRPYDAPGEAWRFFMPEKESPHLVASHDWIELQ